jgi:hypothetical protein
VPEGLLYVHAYKHPVRVTDGLSCNLHTHTHMQIIPPTLRLCHATFSPARTDTHRHINLSTHVEAVPHTFLTHTHTHTHVHTCKLIYPRRGCATQPSKQRLCVLICQLTPRGHPTGHGQLEHHTYVHVCVCVSVHIGVYVLVCVFQYLC